MKNSTGTYGTPNWHLKLPRLEKMELGEIASLKAAGLPRFREINHTAQAPKLKNAFPVFFGQG